MPKARFLASTTQMQAQAETILDEPIVGGGNRRVRAPEAQLRRCAQMSILYHDNGWSLEQVGLAYGVSRERVRQIFEEYDLPTRAPNGHQTYDDLMARQTSLKRLRERLDDG